jgi:hypothetical protein
VPLRLVALACLLAIALSVPALLSRVAAERQVDTLDVALVDSALRTWEDARDVGDQRALATRLTDAGVRTVVVGMVSVSEHLQSGALVAVVGSGRRGRGPVPKELAGPGPATVLRGRTGDQVFARVVDGLRREFGDRVTVATRPSPAGPVPYVRVDGTKDVSGVSLGYDVDRLRRLVAVGFRVVVALPTAVESRPSWLRREVDRAVRLTGSTTVLALGPLPFADRPADAAAFAEFLAARRLDLAVPDLGPTPGAALYAARLPGRIVRAHVVPVTRQSVRDLDRLVVRGHRAGKERGVSLLVVRPSPALSPARATDGVSELASRTRAELPAGLRAGPPTAMPAVEPGLASQLAAFGAALLVLAVAGAWLVGTPVPFPTVLKRRASSAGPSLEWRALPRGAVAVVWAAVGLIGVGALVSGRLVLWQLVTLAVAVAGASLGVLVALGMSEPPAPQRLPRRTLAAYGLGVLVATTTGLVVAALGSRSVMLVGAVPFLGVKVLLLAPPLVVAVVGALRVGSGTPRWTVDLAAVARRVRPHHVLAALAVLGAAGYYLVRSGNSGIAPGPELWLRDALDQALYVRPRFKEAFLGFPALVVALAGRWTTLPRWMWGAVAAVGTASLVDTFAHFHMPLALELLRSAYSVVIGLVVGSLIVWWWRGRKKDADVSDGAVRSPAEVSPS